MAMGELINRIPGSSLLISRLPGSALITLVESLVKPCDVNVLQVLKLPGTLDIKNTHQVSSIYHESRSENGCFCWLIVQHAIWKLNTIKIVSVTEFVGVSLTWSWFPKDIPSPGMVIVVYDTTVSGNVDSCKANFVLISKLQAFSWHVYCGS